MRINSGGNNYYPPNPNNAMNRRAASAGENKAADLSEIERTRIIPTITSAISYQSYRDSWNSHCGTIGDSDVTDVDAAAESLAAKFVENGFIFKETAPSEKNTDFGKAMAAILAVHKARVPMQAKEISEILKESGIEIGDGEAYDIRVNKLCEITVTGSDAEKAQRIQDALNSSDQLGWKLNRLSNMYSPRYDVKDGEEYDRAIFHEMTAESTIKELSGGRLSMKDLSLSGGKIMGLPAELDELINRTKPDMTDDETAVYDQIYKVMQDVLDRGLDNIPDLNTEAKYENGKLTFY